MALEKVKATEYVDTVKSVKSALKLVGVVKAPKDRSGELMVMSVRYGAWRQQAGQVTINTIIFETAGIQVAVIKPCQQIPKQLKAAAR
ncbi:hypothetical protein T265_03207 [Opisthorchis viverrini]|uniref:Uncharacterized protein n=1 Tax=Opisthorchis viverrini TaxID=6198 RepID=A0A074ZWT0_OPIVI|nr:hypothetical protein T265_03207 [Opisthorchis viverrini]KER30372.1 hypothetical protein T265_03207 [Opisthorchis viverrini]